MSSLNIIISVHFHPHPELRSFPPHFRRDHSVEISHRLVTRALPVHLTSRAQEEGLSFPKIHAISQQRLEE